MERKNDKVRKDNGKSKKASVPHIKISAVKNDKGQSKVRSKPTAPSENSPPKESLNVNVAYTRKPNGEFSDKRTASKSPTDINEKLEIKKDKHSNHAARSSVENKIINVSVPTDKKHSKLAIRRCASIDVGELNRKKKGKRKRKTDKENLLAQQNILLDNKFQGRTQSSNSVGNRPTTLQLSSSSNLSIFPTPPVPPKRNSNHNFENDLSKLRTNANLSPDISPNDTSAILPPKTKFRLNGKNIPESVSIDLSDTDNSWYRTFPAGEGYRKHGLKYTFPSASFVTKPRAIRQKWVHILTIILFSCLAVLVFCPFVALLTILLPFLLFIRTIFKCCYSFCDSKNHGCCVNGQRLSVTERFWVRNELISPQVAQSLIIVEYGLSVPQIVNIINNRLVLVKGLDDNKLYPRFSQKVVNICSDYAWVEDHDFFIHNHVFAMPKGLESLVDLQDYISELASRPMSFDRPLWEVHVLTDFDDVRDTVLLLRMHPCLIDGASLVKILYKSIADVDSVTTVPMMLGKESCWDLLKSIFYGPLSFFTKIISVKSDFSLLHGKHIHLSGKKAITWSEPFSLSSAVKIKQVTRCTLNEVFMSVAAGSIRNYLLLNGISNPYDMQTSIPVCYGAKTHSSGCGNDVVLINVTLPTNTEGVVPRLWEMKVRMNDIRESSLCSITKIIFKLSYYLFNESIWSKLWIYILRKCTCIISSLPGPEISLRISSKQIKTIFYWFPPIHQVSLAISFFTYGDQIQMAVSADRNVVPNPEVIAKDFIFQMQTLYDQLGHRRIPGDNIVNKKMDLTLLNTEIQPDETAEQLQKKMSMVHQELQNTKHQLDARRYEQTDEDHKLIKKIEYLKEQFRELLVELRKRKAAMSELAVVFSEDDSAEDDEEFEIPRRPFRRRAISVSSRLSTSSVSSTIRPLPAPTPLVTPDYSPCSPLIDGKQVPYTSYASDRNVHTLPYTSRRPSGNRQTMEELEILEYQCSPSMERRYNKPKQ